MPKVTRSPAADEWAAFARTADGGNIFLAPEMAEVMAVAPGHAPVVLAIERGGAIDALTTIVSLSSGPALLAGLPRRSVGYGGIALRPGVDASAVTSLLRAHRPSPMTLFTELRHLTAVGADVAPALAAAGFVWRPQLNLLVDLTGGAEAVLAGIGRRTRKRIRYGLRHQTVRNIEVNNEAQMAAWYGLLRATYRRARVPLADRRLFDAARSVLAPRGMARFTLALVGDAPAACSVELYFGDRAYAWYGGTDRTFSRYVPQELLTYEILRWSAEAGYAVYDWGGAGEPGRPYGVRDFKARFGGRFVNFGRSVKVHHRRLTAAAAFSYRWLLRRGGG